MSDDFDPRIGDRFRQLDGVEPPDTWHAATIQQSSPPKPGNAWRPLLYAAAAVLVVAGLVFATARDTDGEASPLDSTFPTTTIPTSFTTNTTPDSTTTWASTTVPAYASASAYLVAPGFPLTITPPGPLERTCTDIVDVIDVYGQQVGQILADDSWIEAGPDGVVTIPACLGDTSAEPRTVVVPEIADGPYRVCITPERDQRGCVDVQIDRLSAMVSTTAGTTTTSTTTVP